MAAVLTRKCSNQLPCGRTLLSTEEVCAAVFPFFSLRGAQIQLNMHYADHTQTTKKINIYLCVRHDANFQRGLKGLNLGKRLGGSVG